MAKETQQTITEWIEQTFGPAGSNARVVARANEEMSELLRDVTTDDRHPNIPEEMADVVIVLFRVATRMGVDLMEEVDKKMEINRCRTWELDGSGCGYHT
jgi:NTP pyrophosphatase (non-canonical NTP hydrolase)